MTSSSPVAAAARTVLPLRAGLWSLLYENGYIRSISIGNTEAVRRIYFSVRDEIWNTISGDITDLKLIDDTESFSLSFTSRNRRNAVDFRWQAEITGTKDGTISYAMTGEALAPFRQKRIGFCVLHPLSCKGIPCTIRQEEGHTVESSFPIQIAPHQIFTRMRSMRYRFSENCMVDIGFEGELFETEDQRNWTDATFKTYAPLQLPDTPELIEKGTIVRQKVTLRYDGTPALAARQSRSGQIANIDLSAKTPSLTMPLIGLIDTPGIQSRAGELLSKLHPSHLRVDLTLHELPLESEASRAIACFQRTSIPLECAITFTDDFRSEADHLAAALSDAGVKVARFLIYHRGGPAALGPAAGPVCTALRRKFPDAQLCTGTDGYFVEINRVHPPVEPADGSCYSATPQVHTFDNVAIMENLPGLFETLETGRTIAHEKTICISPLTLRPRKKPDLPAKDGGPDYRQPTLFAAAWMLGSLVWCLRGNVRSLTLCEIAGPGGSMTPDGMAVYPCWLVLAGFAKFAGKKVMCGAAEDPSSPVWIAGENLAIAANITGESRQVTIDGLEKGCSCALLDEEAFQSIKTGDDPISALRKTRAAACEGIARVEFPPYGLVFFFS